MINANFPNFNASNLNIMKIKFNKKEYMKNYNKTYYSTPEAKQAQKKWHQSPEGKAKFRAAQHNYYFKYCGKSRASLQSFYKRKDRMWFEKVSRQKTDQEVIDFFQLEDCFNEAKEIHRMYYNARKKSAIDFCNYFASNEFQYYITTLQKKFKISNSTT